MMKFLEDVGKQFSGAKALLIVLVVGLFLGLLGGLSAGWKLWSPKPKAPETYAAAVRQADQSLILERKPDAEAKPAQQIPKGAVVERVVQVTVKPSASAEATDQTNGAAQPGAEPPAQPTGPGPASVVNRQPVRVDLTLLRMPDQSRRVVASSPDGEVVGGVDIPVESAVAPRVFKWAAGGVYGVASGGGRSVGAFLHRDVAFLRVGAEVTRDTATNLPGSWNARALVGIRF